MRKILFTAALLFGSTSFAAPRTLICEGDNNYAVNPERKSVSFEDKSNNGEFKAASLKTFDVQRCQDCYRASGSIALDGTFLFTLSVRRENGKLKSTIQIAGKEIETSCNALPVDI